MKFDPSPGLLGQLILNPVCVCVCVCVCLCMCVRVFVCAHVRVGIVARQSKSKRQSIGSRGDDTIVIESVGVQHPTKSVYK